jgi:hypothetical protein
MKYTDLLVILGLLSSLACGKGESGVAKTEANESGSESDVSEAEMLEALALVNEVRANAKPVAPIDEPEAPSTETGASSAVQKAELDLLKKTEKQMCQCKDLACATSVASGFASYEKMFRDFDDDTEKEAEPIHNRMKLCSALLESEKMRGQAAFVDNLCKCRSKECIEPLMEKMKASLDEEFMMQILGVYADANKVLSARYNVCIEAFFEREGQNTADSE